MAMLDSTLVNLKALNYTADPYNITWYDVRTGREVSTEAGRILVRGETLWFLNVTLDDYGKYMSILRYAVRGSEMLTYHFLSLKEIQVLFLF